MGNPLLSSAETLYDKKHMLTDSFHKRYPRRLLNGEGFPPELRLLLNQVTYIIAEDLFPKIKSKEILCQNAHNKLAREYGIGFLAEGQSFEARCVRLLSERYDLWNNRHGDPDFFLKMRLGLVELLFREAENHFREEANERDVATNASNELNSRFKEARVPLTYHNGYIQLVGDPLTDQELEKPFWKLLSDPKWKNVDYEMKEAINSRDAGKEDSVTYAIKALESTVKIISDDKGWTTGLEKGASNFIDHLVSKKNGEYIEDWEAESMKHLFSTLRNPRSHGAGSGSRPKSHEHQRVWAIEACMSWIKSLIKRL